MNGTPATSPECAFTRREESVSASAGLSCPVELTTGVGVTIRTCTDSLAFASVDARLDQELVDDVLVRRHLFQ